MGNPEIPDGAPPAQLEASHADGDFWRDRFDVEAVLPSGETAVTNETSLGAGQSERQSMMAATLLSGVILLRMLH